MSGRDQEDGEQHAEGVDVREGNMPCDSELLDEIDLLIPTGLSLNPDLPV